LSKYYALAVDSKGNSKLIDNLSDVQVIAENQAKAHCKSQGLTFQSLRPTKNSNKQGSTLTKFARARAIINGKLGRIK
jgi:anionic cell wall polymer biosynthesis LytR-Cps2A-Psr (LCP) family protein